MSTEMGRFSCKNYYPVDDNERIYTDVFLSLMIYLLLERNERKVPVMTEQYLSY